MKTPPANWSTVEARLRAEAAAPAPGPHHVQDILRAVRTQKPHAPAVAGWPRWAALAGLAAAVVAMVLLVPSRPAPEVETAAAGKSIWPVARMDQAADAPLEREWSELRGDLGRTVGFLANCLPAGLGTPPG